MKINKSKLFPRTNNFEFLGLEIENNEGNNIPKLFRAKRKFIINIISFKKVFIL